MTLEELWHFPRPNLARAYLDLLNTGLANSTTIFAPRRTGKTEFLRRDLTPAAEKAGYRVVYADLWQTQQSPGVALVRALEVACEPRSLFERIGATLKTPVRAVKGKAEVAGTKVEGEVSLEVEKKTLVDQALQLDQYIDALTRKGPLLLLVDEAQSLARNAAGEDVARALRTSMTTHPQDLRVVFTGSSRTKLGHVFSNSAAPLFSAGVNVQDFPLLDDAFVAYIVGRYQASSGRTLDLDVARRAFESFAQRPEPFKRAILAIMLEPALGLDSAVAQIQASLAREENHEGSWGSLDATERVLVTMIAANANVKLFSARALDAVRKAVGIDTLTTAHLQKALGRLARKTIVEKTPRGTFEFEHESFAEWVRNLAD